MNGVLVASLIGLGAGAIAIWIDVRFPKLAPKDLGKSMLHVGASVLIGYAAGPALGLFIASEDQRVVLLGVFGIGFPTVVYCLLAGLWMIKVAQRMLSGNFR